MLELKVIFNSDNLFAVEKPNGISSARQTHGKHDSVVDWVEKHFPDQGHLPECGLLHRLDHETSGVLLFSKNLQTHSSLRETWNAATVCKIYQARTLPIHPIPSLTDLPRLIETPIAHLAKSKKKMIALSQAKLRQKSLYRGKPQEAQTEILSVKKNKDGTVDFKVRIHTGVMHQIRVHLANLGFPILGDPLYSKIKANRMHLHACELKLLAPWNVEIKNKAPWK